MELIFIPPKAVAFALWGMVKKLKVAFPAVVWPLSGVYSSKIIAAIRCI
jgi:hypothetical protein